ncbi:MAG: bifunctional riboflavin kinase/FAD synthetase [Bacteroidota bacterium]
MKIYNSVDEFDATIATVVTIGTFDGVHIGHRKIIDRLVKSAQNNALQATLLTFFPHPRMVLQQSTDLKLINTIDEKKQILAATQLDNLVIEEFTHQFSRIPARDFVEEILVKKLNAKKIIIGYDHRFGRNRTADINDLKLLGKEFDFEVEEISKQDIEEVAVSSTKIRNALNSGEIQLANQYLDSEFSLSGTVVKGKGLGKDFGYPTANLHIAEDYKLIPKQGVYVVKSTINNKQVFGMMNIGTNPTVGGTQQSIETHFFDFDSDIYNEQISIQLLSRIRSEKHFESIDELKLAMKEDQEIAIKFIRNYVE